MSCVYSLRRFRRRSPSLGTYRRPDLPTSCGTPVYRLVDAAYERRSLALSSNLHPSGFDQLMDKTIASALVDRLLHHAHVIVTDGESVRLEDALAGKGVVPLA